MSSLENFLLGLMMILAGLSIPWKINHTRWRLIKRGAAKLGISPEEYERRYFGTRSA